MGIADMFDLVPWIISAAIAGLAIYAFACVVKSWGVRFAFVIAIIAIVMAVLGVSGWMIALFIGVVALCWFLLFGEGRSQDLMK